MSEKLWTVRERHAGDKNALVSLWLESFFRSSTGREYHFEGGKAEYWRRHEPLVHRLLARSQVRLAVDIADPNIICAFVVTEGEDVLHYAMAKRVYHRAGVTGDMFRDLLGPMMARRVYHTHELPEFARAELVASGFRRPESWIWSPYLLADGRAAA